MWVDEYWFVSNEGFKVVHHLLLFFTPVPFDVFLCECRDRFSVLREIWYEHAIIVAKAKKGASVGKVFACWPVSYAFDFDGVHACHPPFKDYPQVIDAGRMENTFFGFEIKVVFFCNLQHVSDSFFMCFYPLSRSNGYIVHVDTDCNACH